MSKTVIYKCDRCSKLIEADECHRIDLNMLKPVGLKILRPHDEIDLCKSCQRKLAMFIEGAELAPWEEDDV